MELDISRLELNRQLQLPNTSRELLTNLLINLYLLNIYFTWYLALGTI